MRANDFFQFLQLYLRPDAHKIEYFSSDTFKGGWEGWLQAEIGYTFKTHDNRAVVLRREVPYTDANNNLLRYDQATNSSVRPIGKQKPSRADFVIERSMDSSLGVELKCSSGAQTLQQSWSNFADDTRKIRAMVTANQALNCIALLAVWGLWDQPGQPMNFLPFQTAVTPLENAFILDYANPTHPALTAFSRDRTKPQNTFNHTGAQISIGGEARLLIIGGGIY